MGFTQLAVILSVTMIHLVSGMSFMTPEPDTPPTSTPDSYPLGDLIHAALQSKEYLGQASAGTGTTTNPTQAVPGLGQTESTATVISPGLLTTALSSSSAASQTGSRNTMSSLPIEEETTTTLITTTTITTMHMPGTCMPTPGFP
eukprot:superscaffoldBa00002838_g15421